MIYFDNSATGGFKPNTVQETAIGVMKYLLANPGRSGHRLSVTGGNFVYQARKRISKFFNNDRVEKVIFTKNCTEALNIAIFGTLKKGDKVITTIFEHNSVLRPLFYLRDLGVITLKIIAPINNYNITLSDIEREYTSDTNAVIINHVSNVTGAINEVEKIGNFLKDKNTVFIVDGAQSGGHVKIDMISSGIDILCLAGHKGLMAIAGSGVLILQKDIEVAPFMMGGTGTETFNPHQPTCYPEKLEAGTLNLPSICSLLEGIRYLEKSIAFIGDTLYDMTGFLIEGLQKIENVVVYSKPNTAGIVAFRILNLSSMEVGEILSNKYDIAVRSGFHCAPLVHKFLKTDEDGLVRVSLSIFNSKKEITTLHSSLKAIVKSI